MVLNSCRRCIHESELVRFVKWQVSVIIASTGERSSMGTFHISKFTLSNFTSNDMRVKSCTMISKMLLGVFPHDGVRERINQRSLVFSLADMKYSSTSEVETTMAELDARCQTADAVMEVAQRPCNHVAVTMTETGQLQVNTILLISSVRYMYLFLMFYTSPLR